MSTHPMRASTYMEQDPLELKRGTNKSRDVVGDFNSLLSVTDGTYIGKLNGHIHRT